MFDEFDFMSIRPLFREMFETLGIPFDRGYEVDYDAPYFPQIYMDF